MRVAGRVQNLEVDHFVVDNSLKSVNLFEIGVIFPDKSLRDESHDQGCNQFTSIMCLLIEKVGT